MMAVSILEYLLFFNERDYEWTATIFVRLPHVKTLIIDTYEFQDQRFTKTAAYNSKNLPRIQFFVNIKARMLSALKLARRNETVSLPPEKIRSTATADPNNTIGLMNRLRQNKRLTRN